MTSTSRVPVGEYRCDFHDFGCKFVAENSAAETHHYESTGARHEHIRLVIERLRSLQSEVNHLKERDARREQEIAELKQKLSRLEAHSLRVCSLWELSAADLLAPHPGWHDFVTHDFGYGAAIRASLLESPAAFCFKLRLRPTPQDRTLRWPFRSTLRIDVFPPDGHQQLLPDGCSATLVPDRLRADQLRMLERPGAAGDDESAAIEIILPVRFNLNQVRNLPTGSSFAVRVAVLPEGAD